jgi:hypothetical protein
MFFIIENPQDMLFNKTVDEFNSFLSKINQFEKITGIGLNDMWKQNGHSFQHIKVNLDMQEYIPGLFDLIEPTPRCPISKIMSVFCFLQIETYNLKFEIESKYFDPLILFGESGLVFEEVGEENEKIGEVEL